MSAQSIDEKASVVKAAHRRNLRVSHSLTKRIADGITDIFKIMAIGASYKNGFGFSLPISPDKVKLVTGVEINENYINLNTNKTERGQRNAVIIVCDNVSAIMKSSSGRFVNTEMSARYVDPVAITVTVSMAMPVPLEELAKPPYNPFLIVDMERDHEVHLPDFPPTDLANTLLFGTWAESGGTMYRDWYKDKPGYRNDNLIYYE